MSETPLTVEQVAKRWGCNHQVVRRMLHAKKLRGFRVGNLWRIPADAVQEIEECSLNSGVDTGASNTSTTTESQGEPACERKIVTLRNVG
jgi:excisionase family DNA binding protein